MNRDRRPRPPAGPLLPPPPPAPEVHRVNRPAAARAGAELVRVVDAQRRRPADVGHIRLPLALEVLDHCGGDAVMAICVMAELINPDYLPTTTGEPARPGLYAVPPPTTQTRETRGTRP